MFWDEVKKRETKVIPTLYKNCDMPRFFKIKKYIDFRDDFAIGMRE